MGSQEQLHLSWILWHDDITNHICYSAVQGAKASIAHGYLYVALTSIFNLMTML